MIDWDVILNEIKEKPGHVINWNTPNDHPEYQKIRKMLEKHDVNLKTAQWINYYPKKDFDETVEKEFAELVGCTAIRSWISKVNPGNYVPYHWDVDDREEEYLRLGKLKRFSCFITEPIIGQIIMIGEEYLHSKPKGTVYQWPDYKAWHASTNPTYKHKFLFNFLGY